MSISAHPQLLNPQRIMIIGCSGAGKSTLAVQLSQIVNLPVVHIDQLLWLPGWVERKGSEFDQLLQRAVDGEQWIIDGNYGRSMPNRIARADTIIWLDYPRWLCLYRVLKRRVVYHGQHRPDVGGCTEKVDWEFLKWVWGYRKRSRPRTVALLAQVSKKQRVIVFKRPGEVGRWLSAMRFLAQTVV